MPQLKDLASAAVFVSGRGSHAAVITWSHSSVHCLRSQVPVKPSCWVIASSQELTLNSRTLLGTCPKFPYSRLWRWCNLPSCQGSCQSERSSSSSPLPTSCSMRVLAAAETCVCPKLCWAVGVSIFLLEVFQDVKDGPHQVAFQGLSIFLLEVFQDVKDGPHQVAFQGGYFTTWLEKDLKRAGVTFYVCQLSSIRLHCSKPSPHLRPTSTIHEAAGTQLLSLIHSILF